MWTAHRKKINIFSRNDLTALNLFSIITLQGGDGEWSQLQSMRQSLKS
nr:MAG TPA: hypothetical protein [Caudoviricetes sp.]